MAIDLTNTNGRAYKELLEHYGHEIEIGVYGDRNAPENVAIEYMTCHVVLVDFGPGRGLKQ